MQFNFLPRWVRRTEWFDETIDMPFEMITLPVPSKYHELLSHEYGDYMKFVKGGACHDDVIIDAEKLYNEYLPRLKKSKLGIILYSIKSLLK